MFQKQLAKLSEKEKKILYVAIIALTLALFDRLFLGPASNKLESVKQEIEQQKKSIKQDLRVYSYKDQILQESEAFADYMVDKVLDDDVVNAAFLSVVEKLATNAKVNLIKSNPSEIVRENNYAEYYANLDCAGSLEDVISFMHAINSTDELLKIVRFNMTPKRGTDNEVNASMTIVRLLMNSGLVKKIPSAQE